jgi:hypothetical protein
MNILIKIISKIRHSIRNRDAADVAGRSIIELDAAPAEDSHLPSIKDEIIALKDRLVRAIQPDKLASELESIDALRDDTYRALFHLIRGYAYHLDAVIKNAAEEVLKVLDKYGLELPQLNYAAQSIEIESLLEDMKQASIITHLESLSGAQGLIDKLEAEQGQFVVAQKAYLDSLGESKMEESATVIKKQLLAVINNKLVMNLDGMMQVTPEPYVELCTKLSIVIDEANELVDMRSNSEDEAATTSNISNN